MSKRYDKRQDRRIPARSSGAASKPYTFALQRRARLADYKKLQDQTRELLKTLTPQEELVLRMRFGLGHTLEEIARSSNVTREQVRHIESKALRKLRHPSRARKLFPGLDEAGEIVEATLPLVGEESTEGSFLVLPLVTPELLNAIKRDPELLRTVDGRSFERILAELLERQGYQVELQRGTKDGGIDIFALMRQGPLGPHRYLVQAKRWTRPVGVAPVRELMFLHADHKVTKSCLATTSRFTNGAWRLADDYRWQLELRDFESLQEWIEKALHGQIPRGM
jgi:HJR/Mrr/RecB family endonuclease